MTLRKAVEERISAFSMRFCVHNCACKRLHSGESACSACTWLRASGNIKTVLAVAGSGKALRRQTASDLGTFSGPILLDRGLLPAIEVRGLPGPQVRGTGGPHHGLERVPGPGPPAGVLSGYSYSGFAVSPTGNFANPPFGTRGRFSCNPANEHLNSLLLIECKERRVSSHGSYAQ
jgi:hypothetical protein